MPRYHLFGLATHSDRALPGLAETLTEADPDLDIVTMCGEPLDTVLPTLEWTLRETYHTLYQLSQAPSADGPYLRMRYEDATEWADYVIGPGGRTIWVAWSAGAPFHDVATLLLGPVLGRTLRMRGMLVLHAGAVAIGGRACCFVGDKGAGKSTTTTFFADRGHSVLTDDLAALTLGPEGVTVVPGHTRVRLRPDAAEAVGRGEELTPIWSQDNPVQKFYLDLGSSAQRTALRLGGVYVLGERVPGGPTRLSTVPPAAAQIELLRHTYAGAILGPQQRAAEFAQMARVVHDVPVRRADRGEGLDTLPALYEAVVTDMAAIGPGP